MAANNDDGHQALIRGLTEMLSDSGEKAMPSPSLSAEEVIKDQLTQNTGRHILDSGGTGGRNWEQNQENPPWEDAVYSVEDGWVVHNVYHFLRDNFRRDATCVDLEIGLYALGYSDRFRRESWRECTEAFFDLLAESRSMIRTEMEEMANESIAQRVVSASGAVGDGGPPFQFNTYNGEWHSLSQTIQGYAPTGPYAEYGSIRIHGGADVRGGYTGPRIYRTHTGGWIPHELHYRCDVCEWSDAESVLGYDNEVLEYFEKGPYADDVAERFPDASDDAVEAALDTAEDAEYIDGAVLHHCEGDRIGHVTFS